MTFQTGQIVATKRIVEKTTESGLFYSFVANSLKRYKKKDWGNTCREDWEMNDFAAENNERIVALYQSIFGDIFIITEWDRSVTTILFTEEY